MSRLKRKNLENIKSIFESRTGTTLPGSSRLKRPVKVALVLAALVGCLSISALTGARFSSLQGDELSLDSVYEGGGVVSVRVENRSDKLLKFEPDFYLRRWKGGSVQVDMDKVRFENLEFAPQSGGVMRIDLSQACDVAALEEPLEDGDWYYFLLTNDSFIFGQDWMSAVDFSGEERDAADAELSGESSIEPSSGERSRELIEESLRPYFENVSLDIMARRQQAYEYIAAYTELLEEFEGEVLESVSPCLPGNRIDAGQPQLSLRLREEDELFCQWTSVDNDYRLIAAEGEYAYVVKALLPAKDGGSEETVPMLFILSYEQSRISSDSYAFIHGRLLSFDELEEYKVYEGEGRVSYEISGLIFDDPAEYVRACDAQDGETMLSAESVESFADMYGYYSGHLSELIYYKK